ncbi:MAG: ATP-dependent RecD-like DNA helicase [bacterium ADurb.Bin236]|nr:MAG: ATP-dependent RecD-like DNA helicase [bacterium ADurb.Bin236]
MNKSNARKKQKDSEALRGTVTHIYFTSDRFTAGRILPETGPETSFAGKFGGLKESSRVILHGAFSVHEKYGEQFQALRFEYNTEFDVEGIANYIASNPEMKGIGMARAVKIARFCGDDFDRIVTEEPEKLMAIPGVTSAIANALHNEWVKHKEYNRCMTQLAAFDLTHKQIMALIDKYGNNAAVIIQENPYRLIEDVRGYGFKKADTIARKAGTSKSSPYRIRSAITFVIENALNDGDCFVEYRELIARADKILILDSLDSRELIEEQLECLLKESGKIICHPRENQFFIALKSIYEMERFIAARFRDNVRPNKKLDVDGASACIPDTLNDGQQEAVRSAIKNAVSLISGGAGTGKTYTVSCIVDLYRDSDLSVVLAAPTGKAAKRLEQATGASASTIHRLLGYDGSSFQRGPDNPIDADILILDEVSMLDVPLCWHLFQAIDFSRTNLVLVGDHNQLPPVGPGNILRDLIHLKSIPATILTEVVRQAGILKENSITILSGRVPPNVEGTATRKEWYVIDKFKDPKDVVRFILYLYENVLSEKLGFDLIRDVQLLAPMKKGVLGVDNLNIELQRLLQKKCFEHSIDPVPPNRRPKLHVSDKVIQNRNNYDLDVMNGAVGYITRIEPGNGIYHIEFDDGVRVFEQEAMKNISLAYASTIHKMQGSECECVVTVVHKSQSFMHHRNLLYTAVTRAKKTAIIIGDRWGIKTCAERAFSDKRKTFQNLEGFIDSVDSQ